MDPSMGQRHLLRTSSSAWLFPLGSLQKSLPLGYVSSGASILGCGTRTQVRETSGGSQSTDLHVDLGSRRQHSLSQWEHDVTVEDLTSDESLRFCLRRKSFTSWIVPKSNNQHPHCPSILYKPQTGPVTALLPSSTI